LASELGDCVPCPKLQEFLVVPKIPFERHSARALCVWDRTLPPKPK
jgi:hypothetical protein